MAMGKDMPQPSDVSSDRPEDMKTSAAEVPDVQELQVRLEEAERERAQFRAIAQRAQADLVNYRQRVEREREESRRVGMEHTILKLLPVLDDLQLALKHAPTASGDASWVEGIRLIERRLLALLESEGVAAIAAEGKPFDPWQHEALFSVEDQGKEPGTVATVIRQGYTLQDKVLRVAQVGIVQAKAPSIEQQAQPQPYEAGGSEERKQEHG